MDCHEWTHEVRGLECEKSLYGLDCSLRLVWLLRNIRACSNIICCSFVPPVRCCKQNMLKQDTTINHVLLSEFYTVGHVVLSEFNMTEKSSEASSWRESGSRLGLGAGTDRDFPDSKLSGSRKRSSGAFTDRTSDRGYFLTVLHTV